MALQRTAWMRMIMENIFMSNQFIEKSLNWDEYVIEGIKTVVIPQAGIPAGFERNRSSLPATIAEVADSDIQYDMVNYTADPKLVRKLEQVQMSYDKMQSVTRNMILNIQQGVADDILYAWRTENTTRNILTTGAARPTGLPGATGNRKMLAYADLVALSGILDTDEVPTDGRQLLLPSRMYNTLLLDPDIKENFNSKLADLNKGILGEILGFTVMKRGRVLRYTSAGVAKLPTVATVATDAEAGLAWHPSFVGRSKGNVDVYADDKVRPEYYGRVISCEIDAGGKKAYADGRGVAAIVQDAAA